MELWGLWTEDPAQGLEGTAGKRFLETLCTLVYREPLSVRQ